MNEYGQFCAVARALEILGERWTLLVVRELLLGSTRFNEIHQGLPNISKTMLSARLRTLERAGIVERRDRAYLLTAAGRALAGPVRALGEWAAEWDHRELALDPRLLAWDLHRRVHRDRLPENRTLVALNFPGARYFLHVRRPGVKLCGEDYGRTADLHVEADLKALTEYWIGERSWADVTRSGEVRLTGPAELRRAFPTWFSGYLLARTPPA
ncbi:DNA-binding HxlR family transcriptional regulator [Streptosporangium becharense]|uniref:DNA-binding HxlR family transcriptional regulator n=1 Tax=Streptosporangium becharense TaxID=1816182 RepID=A0A7W9IJK6_9ACTN|nr:helix-turn-helix domain-containing protein [Streptosporangium becharense]MBB2913858.1 DNA-binding HxlR family transcriptional regulator [Streptosporangium becharense]MBB5821481.1 DNA-binding HxlR family transcriptional regulator [Streptosporangium becharense]